MQEDSTVRQSFITFATIAGLLTGCSSYQEVAIVKEGWNSDVVATVYKHKYGVEVSKKDWETRGCDGQIICSLKNGITSTKNYSAAVLNGESTQTFSHSKTVEKIETYRKGSLVKEVWNYTSGLRKEEREYLASGSTIATVWYESGNPMSVEEFHGESLLVGRYFRKDECVDGEVVDGFGERKIRDPYGYLNSVDKICDGLLVSQTIFHPNGTPKEVIPYENERINGKKQTFLPSGEPKTIEQWVNGHQQGTTYTFRNGEKYSEVPYENGCRKGIERRFRDGRSVEEEISWVGDERHGPTRAFVGDAVKTDWYYQGKVVSKVVFEQMSHA